MLDLASVIRVVIFVSRNAALLVVLVLRWQSSQGLVTIPFEDERSLPDVVVQVAHMLERCESQI